ncbi:hypothetical protein AB0F81_36985 [Actinoplanes sp. NPDC024001]|uniref:hypothetical protein n=1 Tax=Actinoplanes sp. NPDC024001 TaxID=3154598 RepID=UPI0033FBE7E0
MANRFQLWGQAGWASAEVVGETHYAKAIRALFGRNFDPQGTDITVPVQLIPDRTNRHDRNAVGVWSGGSLLGHLPRPEAARYVQVLTSLTTRGLVPEVNARIHGREWGEFDGRPPAFVGTIRLDLAEPHMLVPANSPPVQEHRLLPSGSAVQVNGQQQFLEALRPLLRREGECWAYVTLHEMADHLVEVRIGDARVGDLSPKMSGELLPALRHLAEQGLVTAARAIVKGNDGKAEVMLYVARAHDLPESMQGVAARQAAAAVSPAAPAASAFLTAGSEASGRAPSSFSSSGVATTGPVTAGMASGSAAPGPAGNPAPATWSTPNEPAPSRAASNEPAPSWMPPGEPVPSWAAPSEPVPSWAAPSEPAATWSSSEPAGMPSWAVPSGGVPSWASSSSSSLPTLPSTGSLPGGSAPRLDPPATGTGSIPRIDPAAASPAVTEPITPTSVRQAAEPALFADLAAQPVSPGAPDPAGAAIAETTVIPALTAVVKGNAGRRGGAAPVSPAPEGNPHPPIPPAPTGIRFAVPPGWPVPPAGWYPPAGWRPDPSWPPAPSGWQWWVPTWE